MHSLHFGHIAEYIIQVFPSLLEIISCNEYEKNQVQLPLDSEDIQMSLIGEFLIDYSFFMFPLSNKLSLFSLEQAQICHPWPAVDGGPAHPIYLSTTFMK